MIVLHGAAIQRFLRDAARESRTIRIAAPFWGADSLDRLGLRRSERREDGPSYRLLCNLESGACNPKPIRTLKYQLRWGVKTNARLHAKVYLFDEVAVLGSANPSANGLALQDEESDSWHEVCGATKDPGDITRLVEWFDRLYDNAESKRVTEINLQFAQDLWNRRRRDSADILRSSAKSLKSLALDRGSIVRDNTWIWIYHQADVSEESDAHNAVLRKDHAGLSDVPYEVETDPKKFPYDALIDCFYVRRRNGSLHVAPRQYRLYPALAKRIKTGVSKGLWTLPNSVIKKTGPGAAALDAETTEWLRDIVRERIAAAPDIHDFDWDGTLGQLMVQTDRLPK